MALKEGSCHLQFVAILTFTCNLLQF